MELGDFTDREKRIFDIIIRINLGETCASIGRSLGLSRERIRQLYLKATGQSPNIGTTRGRELKRLYRLKKRGEEIRLVCAICQQEFSRKEEAWAIRYCTKCRSMGYKRQVGIDKECHKCGKTFNPHRSTPSQKYCSSLCSNRDMLNRRRDLYAK